VSGGRPIKCVIPGGVSSKVLTGEQIANLRLCHEDLWDAGSTLGSGGMIVIAEGTCMVHVLQILMRFYHHESCGQCTPCRHGTGWLHRIVDRIAAGRGRPEDIEQIYWISKYNDGTTICGLGDAAGYAAVGILDRFRDEFEFAIANGRPRYEGRLECP
jgi:NADH-quinone oxidoreductase subunit F